VTDVAHTRSRMPPAAMDRVLRCMLRIRVFEERLIPMLEQGEIRCPVHLYIGQEGIAAGVSAHLRNDDFAFSTHRSHGHYIAKGGDLRALMAELLGKAGGCSRGHGGSMHLVQPDVGFMGSSAIVAGTIPIAVGAALTIARQGRDGVSVAFFGDGATDEGVFYESVNFAVLERLPVLFICENNGFSTHLPDFKRQSNPDIHERLAGFRIQTARVEGNDAEAVYHEAERLVAAARRERQPALLECLTYRWYAHVGPTVDEDVGYRTRADIEAWRARCPIRKLKGVMTAAGVLSEESYERLDAEVRREVEDAVRFARDDAYPDAHEISLGSQAGEVMA
jgi:TPP-dependent pyruvate/acetoin dehydrogenase alpha subunit